MKVSLNSCPAAMMGSFAWQECAYCGTEMSYAVGTHGRMICPNPKCPERNITKEASDHDEAD